MQRNQAQQVVGQLGALVGHAAREGVAGELRVRQVVSRNALAKHLAVGHNAADRDAAKVNAVVTLFAPDHDGFAGLTLDAPVGPGDFERGVGRLGARAGEKHVVEPGGREFFQLVGQRKRQRVAVLEGGRIVQRRHLFRHRLGDFFAPVAEAAAPQA